MTESLISPTGESETNNTETETVDTNKDVSEPTTEENFSEDKQSDGDHDVELIFGKYKDMDAAKDAFKTLESENGRLRREKSPEAPEEYLFDFKEDDDLKDIYGDHDFENDPILKDMLPIFKEANITNEQAQSIVRGFGLYQKSNMVDFDSEVAKLDGGLETVSEVENYVQKNYTSEEQEVIASWLTTAEGLSVFKKIAMEKPSNIPGEGNSASTKESSSELINKAMEIKKSTDLIANTSARQKYETLMNKAVEMQMKGL